MNILAVNGSPHGPRGNTEAILQPFLEGARQAGAQTETVYLKDKHIEHCIGCFSCWLNRPGVCVHKDDMPALLEQVRQADVLVLATPLYVFTFSGLLKDFLDRISIPVQMPQIVRIGDQYVHPMRYADEWPKRLVLISNAGFPGAQHFDGLKETMRTWARLPGFDLAGMICCAAGPLLKQPALQESLAWYVDAARRAGQEMVEQGEISAQTSKILARQLAEPAVYATLTNVDWQSQGVEPLEQQGGGTALDTQATPLPLPTALETARDAISGMAAAFNPAVAGDLRAVIQFHVNGKEPGEYYLQIADGSCRAYEGQHPEPTVIIFTPSEVWLAISRGEMNGATALITGKYRVEGNMGLLLRVIKTSGVGGKR